MFVLRGIKDIILESKSNYNLYLIYLSNDENLLYKEDFKIVAVDPDNDLCIIYKKDHGLLPISFTLERIKIRDSVFLVGAPSSYFPIESEGYVSLPSIEDEKWFDRFIISADVFGGNSGGPVFNKEGKVIGMVVAGSGKYLHLGIVVKSKYIVNFIEEYSNKRIIINK